MAIESAGVVLASSDLRGVVSVIKLSKASYRRMLQNLGWAGATTSSPSHWLRAPWPGPGWTLPPAVAAVLMSASPMVVALNAQLLRRVDLRPGPVPVPAGSAS